MAVDQIARMIALDAAQQGGGTTDAYTKAETDALLNEKADLVDGKVPAAQLPSYVDDVLEYASTAAFPATGESGKIYIATDTNKTYRWGGSAYVEISESLALGETASTAYAGNKGKANADAIAAIKDGTNIDSFADVETALSEKLNTSDVDTALSGTSTNPVQNKVVQAPIASLVDRGAKNLLDVRDQTQEVQGISYVVKDGIISASGTATGQPSRQSFGEMLLLPGDYVLCGCPANGSDTTYRIDLYTSTDGTNYSLDNSNIDRGHGVAFTLSAQLYVKPTVRFQNGYVANNLAFKPMICTAEDYAISPEFVPYAPSNRDLYEEVETKATVDDIFGVGNRINNSDDLNNYTSAGIYYSLDYSVTSTLSNCPITQGGFRLEVNYINTTGRCIQKLISNTADLPVLFLRRYTPTGWTSWYKFEGTAVT